MKLIQCPNNHYYDSDKFSSCPYCAQLSAAQNVTAQPGSDASNMPTSVPASAAPVTPESFGAPDAEPSSSAPWTSAEDVKTVSYFARTIGIEPVVGWLVAIGGSYFGEDFRLKSGRNFIGRSPEMDIQLSLDTTVSRRKHAIIIYEPKSRMFIAQPGDSRELFYLNDKVVLNSTELKDRDILTIGETRLMLVSLCNSTFSWEDHAKENR